MSEKTISIQAKEAVHKESQYGCFKGTESAVVLAEDNTSITATVGSENDTSKSRDTSSHVDLGSSKAVTDSRFDRVQHWLDQTRSDAPWDALRLGSDTSKTQPEHQA